MYFINVCLVHHNVHVGRCFSTVRCYNSAVCSDLNASSTSEMECCNHDLDPPGIAFECTDDRANTCYSCPVGKCGNKECFCPVVKSDTMTK